jgi:hypothetical protein
MACTNCGGRGPVDGYTIRFTGGASEPTEMALELCEECLEEFRAEPGVELA